MRVSSSAVRRLAGAAALLSVAASLPAHAATAHTTLSGTTTVTGSRSAWTAVRLPRAVDFDPSRDVSVTGRGRLYGVLLKKDGGWDSPVAWRVGIGYCAAAGCAPTFPDYGRSEVFVRGGNTVTGRLPAGTYRLYLIADGAPVRARLTFRGVSGGTRTLAPRNAARVAVLDPAPTVAEPPSGPLAYAAGSTRAVPSRGGMNITVVWKDHPAKPLPSTTGVCRYAGAPPRGGSTPAYHWPCQGGGPDLTGGLPHGTPPTPVGPGRFISSFHTSFLIPPGEFSFGGFSDTPSPVSSAHVHQLWVDF